MHKHPDRKGHAANIAQTSRTRRFCGTRAKRDESSSTFLPQFAAPTVCSLFVTAKCGTITFDPVLLPQTAVSARCPLCVPCLWPQSAGPSSQILFCYHKMRDLGLRKIAKVLTDMDCTYIRGSNWQGAARRTCIRGAHLFDLCL